MMIARTLALASIVAITAWSAPSAFAQNAPGSPDSVLGNLYTGFQINTHPDMPFAASAPSAKYQQGKSAARKRGDDGDPDGCNLQCPSDDGK